jgi:hypothetical protein
LINFQILEEEEKLKNKDPRPAIFTLYPSKADYMNKVKIETNILIEQGFVLPQDKAYLEENASSLWDLLTGNY